MMLAGDLIGDRKLGVLTVWPEWLWAFVYLGKRTENRTWSPPRELLRRGLVVALHGGKHLGGRPGADADDEARAAVRRMFSRGPAPPGWTWPQVPLDAFAGQIAAVAELRGVDTDDTRTRWDVGGSMHWRFPKVYVLETPVRTAGAQGLWTPSAHLLEQIRSSRVELAEHPGAPS